MAALAVGQHMEITLLKPIRVPEQVDVLMEGWRSAAWYEPAELMA